MASYKEIVTKAVVGKGRKSFSSNHLISPEISPTTILGCWVINHLLVVGENLINFFIIKYKISCFKFQTCIFSF